MSLEVTREDIEAAARRIQSHVRRTPSVHIGQGPSDGYALHLKLESMQPTGSFKVRGAFSLLTSIDVPKAGVVAASGGNFGLAVARAAGELGLAAVVFVPETSPSAKLEGIAAFGAEVRVVPGHYPEALAAATAWSSQSGAFQAHAYDQAAVVAGQGTCALEVTEDLPGVDTVLVAVGGGGLIGGIASWVRDDVRLIGVETEQCPTLFRARQSGQPVEVQVGGIAASAMGASRIGEHAWFANRWIDDAVLVDEGSVMEAMSWLWKAARLVAEPAAAAPLAALATGAYKPKPGESVMVVVSGANTDPGSVG